jgi:RNA polymerase sigma-70 factor (ECF subfamily)
MDLPEDLARDVQLAWHRFVQRTETLRPDLHRFCRSLTGSVWDAEDLVQDTLLRAFAKLGELAQSVDNPRGYLFRIASNLWTDRFRRGHEPLMEEEPMTSPGEAERSLEVRDAARHLIGLLPPQERAAVVLKDVFDLQLDEIATTLQTTTGAVKAALHRGRGKLAAPALPPSGAAASAALLDRFVDAFNARDLDRVAALLRTDAIAEVVGIGVGHGRRAIRDSSLYYSLFLEKGDPRVERRTYQGEPVLVVWYAIDSSGPMVRDILRFEELEGEIARLRFFCFCPETMAEIARALGVPFRDCGYGVWAPQFLELQRQEEFQEWMAARMNGGSASAPATR